MKLLEIGLDNKLTITPEALMIKEFKALWDRNKDKNKVLEELAFVYWMAYYNSVYDVYMTDKEKMDAIKADVISTPNWTPDDKIFAAIEKFKELQRTFSMAFLESAKLGAVKIRAFFENVDLNERNKNGAPIWKPVDISNAISKSVDTLESLEKWKERVRKETELEDSKIKGGGRAGLFEDEDSAIWLNSE